MVKSVTFIYPRVSWIGAHNPGTGWLWDDGSTMLWQAWADDAVMGPSKASLDNVKMALYPKLATERRGYICQMDATC